MTDIKISVSDKLDGLLQDKADDIGIKKAETVKNIVIKEVAKIRIKKLGRKNTYKN